MTVPGPKRLRILFVDDEKSLREVMRAELPRLGHEVTVCADGREAIQTLEKASFDLAMLDINMPGLSGIDVIRHIRENSIDTDVLFLTGRATLESAVEALRHGAFDYLTKPCRMADLELILQRAAEKRQLQNKALALESRLRSIEGPPRLVGGSRAIQQVMQILEKVAPTDATVLILGETGTGKEVVARTIHEMSLRRAMPFVPVNCGALPEHLVESELFGHRKGAFTGADQNRKGLFEVANGGTLFLDEVGELPMAMQAKLLRFLESREIRRVGENEPFQVDVRVVCATNRDLREMASKEEFREDLYFRINTFEVHLPSLRDRADDIPELAQHLLVRAAKGKPVGTLADEAKSFLQSYDWPGNVRELANVMEYAYIISGGKTITIEHLPQHLKRTSERTINTTLPLPTAKVVTLHELEIRYILERLEQNHGNKPETAKQLGISLKTLYNKLNTLPTNAAVG